MDRINYYFLIDLREGHIFRGKWVTNNTFCNLAPINVFHKQLEQLKQSSDSLQNQHILFRKKVYV